MTELLNDEDPVVRRRAAGLLVNIGPKAKVAVPALIAALKDNDKDVRKNAALALGIIGPAAIRKPGANTPNAEIATRIRPAPAA